jgi:valyl-tRNA synthetase
MQVFVLNCVDDAQERQRLHKELTEVDRLIAGKEKKLANANFAQRAPADVVQAERDRLAELRQRRARIQATLSLVEG